MFATGGTIGMHETDAGLAPDPGFPDALEHLVAGICTPLGLGWRINHLQPPIDSANADADTAPKIARAVRARARTQQPRGVVITHGTDTLAFTASRLAFDLADLGIPVVVTGSQLPHGSVSTDAGTNLSLAIRAAVRAAPAAPVSIAFGGAILPAVRAEKHHTTSLGAFRAERDLAPDASGVPPRLPGSDQALSASRVLTFRFTPGVTADDLRGAIAGSPDGLILECYGAGNGPMARPGMLGTLREICDAIPVVAVSQCAQGGVNLARYAVGQELRSVGAIDGSDLTIEAATAKLGFLLDAGYRGADLCAQMSRNLVGEATAA